MCFRPNSALPLKKISDISEGVSEYPLLRYYQIKGVAVGRFKRYPCGYVGFDRPDERQEGCFEREFSEYFIYLGNIGWKYEIPWRDRR